MRGGAGRMHDYSSSLPLDLFEPCSADVSYLHRRAVGFQNGTVFVDCRVREPYGRLFP